MIQDGVTSGDFLQGCWLGKRQALNKKGRKSIYLTLTDVSGHTIGVLVAIFERAEAGKKAANTILALQLKVRDFLKSHPDSSLDQIADAVGIVDIENVFNICEHLAANQN